MSPKFTCVLIILGDADEIYSEEVLESQNVTKSLVPQLTDSKSDSKGNQDLDEQPPKVMCLMLWGRRGGE